MPDYISDAALAGALDLFAAEEQVDPQPTPRQWHNAFARYIQRVSDAAKVVHEAIRPEHGPRPLNARAAIAPFILPDPVDPRLEAAMLAAREERGLIGSSEAKPLAEAFARQLEKRGLKIVEAKL